jgi:hypothetical protein
MLRAKECAPTPFPSILFIFGLEVEPIKELEGVSSAISMDATFGTNDMKFHLFTFMAFDDHRTGVPLT